jgi:hypothetical protein
MGLQSYAVDSGSVRLDGLDDALGGARFGTGVLDIVVVVVELGAGPFRGFGCGRESERDVARPDDVVPYACTVGAVVEESLVDNIPA